jgi:2-phospho-L-lactate guanylyltransferase
VSCLAIIPIKALDDCKTRLRPALNDPERHDLVRAMLANVLRATQDAAFVDRVALLGPERHGAADSVLLIADDGQDLNAGLSQAVQIAAPMATRIIIVAADLPRVLASDIDALAHVTAASAAIAPDRAGSGTNALSLPLPLALAFRFSFGPGSFERHRAEAERMNLPLTIINSDTLALDIDRPADLEALRSGAY